MYILKIGGSLITDKNAYCVPRKEEIKRFAKMIKSRWFDLQGKLVVVIGGGSYGNGVPLRYNLLDSEKRKKEDLLMMTVKMFEWINEVAMIFRNEGLPVYPFQTSSYCTTNEGNYDFCFMNPIKMSLQLGLLPITSGDFTFDKKKNFTIYSSDNVPELFVDHFDVQRVVILTDVPGIFESDKTKKIIKRVNQYNYKKIIENTGSSNKQDVTGGMNNKLKALIRVAQKNTNSIVCDGSKHNLIKALFSENPPGTIIEAWKKGDLL
ncbi:isopentenyl phosphate kinase [Bacillus rugosus]|uniref:Isopentenyl phosphate kinase n=1 Tax=Bacillus rugosus TaxID=2715209 RepID=A0ACD3ZYL0_9BACI|nr:isopentenyl phosphate kinase [Bacillus rugosus]UPV78976.1 isopentenyl phosphate kinase [Bacillus rugosus]